MECDSMMKWFLLNDNRVIKRETELLKEYLNCKIEHCFTNSSNTIYTNVEYEKCKENCVANLKRFLNLKLNIYNQFTKSYYQKVISECSIIEDEEIYDKCLSDTKEIMKAKLIELQSFVLNYRYY